MRLFDPNPALRWHFALTHPDDEIAICAWIARLVWLGAPVTMSWTHSNPIREREARAAALLIGVPQANLRFFSARDGAACDQIPELLPQFRRMMDELRPNRVVCGAFEQGHIDHDATNYLVRRSFAGTVLEAPFYHTYLTRFQVINRFSDPRGEEIVELDLDERRLKTTIARQFPSQNIWSVLLWYEVWQRARLRPMELTRTERLRLLTHRSYLVPNHPPRLARRVEASPLWRRWRAAIERAEAIDERSLAVRS